MKLKCQTFTAAHKISIIQVHLHTYTRLIPRVTHHKNSRGSWEQGYVLITLMCLYVDFCEDVFNFGTLIAAIQEYCPPSGDCRECIVRDLVVSVPEVCS